QPRCPEALAALDALLADVERVLQTARAARPANFNGLADAVTEAAAKVRTAVADLAEAAAEPLPERRDRAELDALVCPLGARAQERAANRWRGRLEEVAGVLRVGRIVSHRTGRVIAALDDLRGAAAEEVADVAAGSESLGLPGPGEGPWLDWVWAQPARDLEAL